MKAAVYSWRLSAERKAELEAEARREGASLSPLLDRVTADWLAQRRNGHSDDDAEQAAIRRRAMAAIGSVAGGDLCARIGSANRFAKSIYRKHVKESNALARRFGRRTIDTGAILALIDRRDKWHSSCVKAYDNSRLPLLTSEVSDVADRS
jgi:hypothetical protein